MKANPFKESSLGFIGTDLALGEFSIYYETQSNNTEVDRTFLLVHGACTSGRYMTMLGKELIDQMPNTQVVIVDLPNHGKSINLNDTKWFSIQDYSELLKELILKWTTLGDIKGDLIYLGWGLGGTIGLQLSADTEYLDGLVLLNTAHKWLSISDLLSYSIAKDEEQVQSIFSDIVLSELTAASREVREHYLSVKNDLAVNPLVMLNDFRSMLPEKCNLVNTLEHIEIPVILISGSQDCLAPPNIQEEIAKKLPLVFGVHIMETGHCPHLVETEVSQIVSILNK